MARWLDSVSGWLDRRWTKKVARNMRKEFRKRGLHYDMHYDPVTLYCSVCGITSTLDRFNTRVFPTSRGVTTLRYCIDNSTCRQKSLDMKNAKYGI